MWRSVRIKSFRARRRLDQPVGRRKHGNGIGRRRIVADPRQVAERAAADRDRDAVGPQAADQCIDGGGSIIVEAIFGIPGMGLVGYKAIVARDYTLLMAQNFLIAVLVMVGFLLSDILYVLVDPRISYEGK